ncbi:unnamed protein product, partial [Rotaria sordida]
MPSSKPAKTLAPTTCSLMETATNVNNTNRKNKFNSEILSSKNNSSNNPLFTLKRYNQTIELINGAKLKRYSDRNEKEIALLKIYDVIHVGHQQKLVKNINSSEEIDEQKSLREIA